MKIIDKHLKFVGGSYGNKPNTIILHHAEWSKCSVEDIHRCHLNNGWAGIGYHYFVRKDGSIYKGRPDSMIGSHAKGFNTNSLGICAEGAYDKETMPKAQKDAIVELIKYLKGKYPINKVCGHRDVMATSCPGKNYPLKEIINLAHQNGGASKPQSTKKELWEVSISGSLIKELQTQINSQGYGRVKVDGYFGEDTLKHCPLVRQGARGGITKIIQKRLIQLGYSIYGGVDGIFGSSTTSAIKSVQSKNGLSVDGIVGQNTWKALMKK